MKITTLTLLLLAVCFVSNAQIANDNTMTVKIDGKDYTTQPRRIMIGNLSWITGNTITPDKSLRIWLGGFDHKEATDPGKYVILNVDKTVPQDVIDKITSGQVKGYAFVKYVEETRSPRMEYHVGKSQKNDELIEVKIGKDGFWELTFSAKLEGSYWKERTTATVFGGLGRLKNKLEDKIVTKATGYDQDIDPEGNGYRRQDNKDVIELTNCTIKLKMKQ
jgi:hypothetical protein